MDDTRKAEIMHALSAGIQELTSSDSWQTWLTCQSRFHTYSFLNTLLIQLQAPAGTTRVAGFNAWRRLGRNVRKGEKGIAILAPIVRRTRVEDEDGEQHVITGSPSAFRMVYVFADVQTDGEDLPAIAHRLEGDDPNGLYTRLLPVAASIGFTVEEDYLDAGSNGDCDHRTCRIRIEARNDPRQQVKTLAHELAHAILHGDSYQGSRELAELEAESVAFIVCSSLQLDSSEYSFGYLAGWAGGGDEAIAGIKSAGANIHRAADHILTQLEGADMRASGDEAA
jgi:antirestriction protein ArdC